MKRLLARHGDRAGMLMLAPPGYGKTTALQRWRRELIGSGYQTVTLSPTGLRDPGALSHDLLNRRARDGTKPWQLAAMVAERAARSVRTLAILADDVETMSEAVAAVFAELLADPRAPYRVILAGTSLCSSIPASQLVGYGVAALVDRGQLAYTLTEAIGFAVPTRVDEGLADAANGLFAKCEGWPVAIDAVRRSIRDGAEARDIDHRLAEAIDQWATAQLWPRMSERHLASLGTLAALGRDTVDAGIFGAACRTDDAAPMLEELERETPFVRSDRDRSRVLPLLPSLRWARFADEFTVPIHNRVAQWLAGTGRADEAIPHALAAEQVELARDCIERTLIDAVARGRVVDALGWLDTLPADAVLRGDRNTVLAVVWALAIGGRTDLIETWLTRLAALPPPPPSDAAHERAVIDGLLASVCDDPDRALAALEPFRKTSTDGMAPPVVAVRENMFRWIDQQRNGKETDVARRLSRSDARRDPANFYSYCFAAFRDAETLIDLGQSRAAVRLMHPLRDRSQAEFGPAGAPFLITSIALAAALRQSGDAGEAHLTLPSCATWPEPLSLPSVLWLRTCTAARLARREGDWRRAIGLCDALAARSAAKNLPRLQALSLAEAIRTLVAAGVEPGLAERTDALRTLHTRAGHLGSIRGRLTRLAAAMGLAHAARDSAPDAAVAWLDDARPIALADNRLLALAEIDVLLRELADRAPGAEMIDAADLRTLIGDCAPPTDAFAPGSTRRTAGIEIALTTKETEVLELLTAGLSNKRIAEAMMVSAETVKWHLKNIFNKLDVHDREHVMARARALELA